MKMLSIGVESTMGNYLEYITELFGADSDAVTYLKEKLAEPGCTPSTVVDFPEDRVMRILLFIDTGFFDKYRYKNEVPAVIFDFETEREKRMS